MSCTQSPAVEVFIRFVFVVAGTLQHSVSSPSGLQGIADVVVDKPSDILQGQCVHKALFEVFPHYGQSFFVNISPSVIWRVRRRGFPV